MIEYIAIFSGTALGIGATIYYLYRSVHTREIWFREKGYETMNRIKTYYESQLEEHRAAYEGFKKEITAYTHSHLGDYQKAMGRPVEVVDSLSANVYADWLEENGYEVAAAALRKAFPIREENSEKD